MSQSEQRIRQSLHEGESVREAFDVGPTRVVLTTHRLFVARPDAEGLEQAELLNVTGVVRTTRGSRSGLVWGGVLAVLGVVLVAAGSAISGSDAFDPPEFDEDAAAELGAGPLTDLVAGLLWLLETLDLLLLWGGVAVLGLAVLPVAYYWLAVREPCLTIERAGSRSDIHLPLQHVPEGEERRLRDALAPDQLSEEGP